MSLAHVDDYVINISLPYDFNALTEPDLWDGSFYPISLHRSMEHLASDAKDIRDSLNFMAKYILNKQVDLARSNDLDNFKGIGEAVWNLVSLVYQSKWDSLIADKNNKSLREKIAAKLTPRIIPTPIHNNKVSDISTLASIEKMLSLIPAKSQKEVNQIFKYFRNTKPVNTMSNKFYAQVSKQSYT